MQRKKLNKPIDRVCKSVETKSKALKVVGKCSFSKIISEIEGEESPKRRMSVAAEGEFPENEQQIKRT